QHLPGAGAVPRARDPEPDRVGGDVPAARGAGRPLHAQGARRLSGARRRAHRRLALARQPAGARAGPVARRAHRSAAAGGPALRRPGADLLGGRRRDDDPAPTGAGPRRDRRLHRLRREPARSDQPDRRVACTRADPRPRLRRPRRPAGARVRRAPPPPGALLPGARRRGRSRHDPRAGDRVGADAAHRSRVQDGGHRVVSATVDPLAPSRSAARPGPGPLSTASLRALELSVGRRVDGLLAGDYRSAFAGVGTELFQVRIYEPGDDVRRIEWNVTARTGRPHVRVELAERVLVTWLVLDASASMAFGTGDRRKADVAEGVASAVGWAATKRGNRLGTVAFGRRSQYERPRQGRRALLDTLELLRELPPEGTGTLREALELTDRVARQRSLIVVVSDFRGPPNWRPPLLRLSGRHTVLAVEVRDPREQGLAAGGGQALVG